MKKTIIATVLIVGLAAGFAFAHGNNGYGGRSYSGHMMGNSGMMGGNGMMGGYGGSYDDHRGAAYFGPDDRNSESHQKFLEDTVGLRKELNDRRFDYGEAQRNPNITREQLVAIEKEVIDIRTKLQEQAGGYKN